MKGALTLLGRADLLRALARAGADASQGLRHAETLGFQRNKPDTIKEEVGGTAQAHLVLPALEAASGSAPALPPLQTSFFLLTGCRPLPDAPPADQLPAGQATPENPPPLAEEDCQPRGFPLPFQPLVRRERLWPQLRQSLQHDWMDGLDLPRLVARLARGDLPRSLPARRRSGLTARIFILWDAAERLSPYFEDYRRLIAELHRLHGTAGLRLWRVHDGPDEVWGEWCPERVALPQRWAGETWHKAGSATRGLPPIPAGSRVLILSDMGGLARHTAPSRRWLRALGHWRAAGVSTTAWVPQGPRWVAPALVAAVDDVHCLTARPLRLRASGRPGADSLEAHLQRRLPPWAALCKALLVRASICIHLEPALLRSLRHTDPALAAEPGLAVFKVFLDDLLALRPHAQGWRLEILSRPELTAKGATTQVGGGGGRRAGDLLQRDGRQAQQDVAGPRRAGACRGLEDALQLHVVQPRDHRRRQRELTTPRRSTKARCYSGELK